MIKVIIKYRSFTKNLLHNLHISDPKYAKMMYFVNYYDIIKQFNIAYDI